MSGAKALVTGAAAGADASANDLDGGPTTIRSPLVTLPSPTGKLTFKYSFAHGTNSSSADYFRAYVETTDGHRTLVKEERGGTESDAPAWTSVSVSMAPWAGQQVRIVFQAADVAPYSLVEAEVDDVRHHDGSRQRAGMLARNVVPPLPVDSTTRVPPWASTS